MNKKIISGIMLIVLLISGLMLAFIIQPARAEPTTIIVPDNHSTIQKAINAAAPGDTIYVRAGIYYENVVVNKSLLLFGEDVATTIIDGVFKGTVISVTESGVTIKGFTVRNSGFPEESEVPYGRAGIIINCSSDNSIINNVIMNSHIGIWLYDPYTVETYTAHNTLANNTLKDNWCGMLLESSYNNTLRNNTMIGNTLNFGVASYTYSDYIHDIDASNTVGGKRIYYWIQKHGGEVPSDAGYLALINCSNIVAKNLVITHVSEIALVYTVNSTLQNVRVEGASIILSHSNNNTLKGNLITKSGIGLSLTTSSFNIIINNIIYQNSIGLCLDSSSNNTIQGNMVERNNRWGIYFISGSNSNILIQNTIRQNGLGFWGDAGIYIAKGYNNIIYNNNFIDDRPDLRVGEGENVWDGGYPTGGNFWSKYIGVDLYSGPYQNETGSDGIGDTPYLFELVVQDNYPLMRPFIHPLMCDITHDLIINIYDIVQITASYDSRIGDPYYRIEADLDDDGRISIYDIVIACANYKWKAYE